MRLLFVAIILLVSALPVAGQEEREPPLVIPFTPIPAFMQVDENGVRSGFLVELADLLSAEINVPIEFRQVADSQEFVKVQAAGETQLIAGILQLPGLTQTNVFSQSVAPEVLRPAVQASRVAELEGQPLEGQRIGVVPPALGTDAPILGANIRVDYDNPQAALMALLSDEVDALLLPPPVIYRIAKAAKLDGRIAFVGTPLREATRHVALHQSRADLLEPINDALAQLEADGRLEALRQKYSIILPPPPPAVLTVGVTDFPPYNIYNDDGSVTGFAVEALRDLAELTNLSLEFKRITRDEFAAGPTASTYDMLPQAGIDEDRASRMDFTLALESYEFILVSRRGEADGLSDLDSIGARKVGVQVPNLGQRFAEEHGNLDITVYDERPAMLEALLAGEVDVLVYSFEAMETEIEGLGLKDQVEIILPPFRTVERAPALRPGLGAVRDRLDAVIPAYLLSHDYIELRQQYLDAPQGLTDVRFRNAAIVMGVAFLVFMSVAAAFALRTRARSLSAMAAAKEEFETIFEAATSGIVAFNKSGTIVRINERARHFLGGLSGKTPFPWPDEIKFLDAEDQHPLDASADPIRRALSGVELRSSTHLMSRRKAGENNRYVRIETAMVAHPGTDIEMVLVLDDVSNEERNRQVVERKGRLEALGQLTGGIAHDFNNLLTTMSTSLFLLGRARDEEKRANQLKVANDTILRARTLTARLMAFAKKQPGLAESTNALKVVESFRDLIRPMLEESIELSVECEASDLLVFCEVSQLESAIMNLVLNSRDAIIRSGKGNRISIKVRAVDSAGVSEEKKHMNAAGKRFIEISVMDNGPGMSESVLERAIDPFFTTKDTNSGTGLGLSMVYGFARQSDGGLKIYSELDVGTTIQLTLPRGTSSGQREGLVEPDDITMGNGETILIVEDDIALLSGTSEMLREFGYDVISASSGRDALEHVKSSIDISLLLTDVVMPDGMGGFKLAELTRLERPSIPIIYFSGYTGFSASEMGPVPAPLVQKPAVPAELSRILSNAINDKD